MEEFNPFRFDGRIGRLQYFGYGIIWALVIFLVTVLAGGSRGALGLYIVLMLVFFVGTVSYGVRRLHDLGRTGWWYLLAFVPYANVVLGVVLLLVPGSQGPNAYGARVR